MLIAILGYMGHLAGFVQVWRTRVCMHISILCKQTHLFCVSTDMNVSSGSLKMLVCFNDTAVTAAPSPIQLWLL